MKPAATVPFKIRVSTNPRARIVLSLHAMNSQSLVKTVLRLPSRMEIVRTIERLPHLSSREPPLTYRSPNFPIQHDSCITQSIISDRDAVLSLSESMISPPRAQAIGARSGSRETPVRLATIIKQALPPRNFSRKPTRNPAA